MKNTSYTHYSIKPMKKIILVAVFACFAIFSCSKKESDPTPLAANFEINISGDSPNAQVTLVNKSTGATSYEWTFGEGSSAASSTDETPTGITVDKAGNFKVTLIAKSGSQQNETSQTVTVSGNNAIVSYTDVVFAQDPASTTIGRFFSSSEGKIYLNSEVNATTGALIDLAYQGHSSSFIFFESPDKLFGSTVTVPGATTTKIKNYQSGFSATDFDAMTNDQLFQNLTVEHDGNAIGTLDFPVIVTFENSAGKKGAIKLKSINSEKLTVDIKVQKY